MTVESKQIYVPADVRIRVTAASTGRFLWHFAQMMVAMMVGMMPYHAIFGKYPVGNTILWYAGMELSMIPGMVLLMLYQRHGWRHTAEMAVAMLIGPALFLACAQLGLHNYIPGFSINTFFRLSDAAMILGMLAAMLYRREIYAAASVHHHHAG